MELLNKKSFKNGCVYLLNTYDGYPLETTDTFLPYYTKNAIGKNQNNLTSFGLGDRSERWMIGLSCMSGCPVGCKFCATGKLKKWRNLTHDEIVDQFNFIIGKNRNYIFSNAREHKINYTRMGEPFLNVENVKAAIKNINDVYPNTHHYLSTIGLNGSDFSWIVGNITLQISVHALSDKKRDWLIPVKNKMTIKDLGQIRTKSNLKTTINLTLVDESDFDINILKEFFDPKYFFVKLSPINKNECSELNHMGNGIIQGVNLI